MVVPPHQVEHSDYHNGSLPTALVVSVLGRVCFGYRPVSSLFIPLENGWLAASVGWVVRRHSIICVSNESYWRAGNNTSPLWIMWPMLFNRPHCSLEIPELYL